MSAGPGSKFGFNNKTGELVLTDIYGAQKIYPIISRANTSMPSIYFLALEGNRVAEVSPKDPGSGPEEGCFENKTKTMSMKFIETENPIEYINHKKLFFITPTSLSPEDKMSGMRLLTAQLHERHSGFNPLVLKESELAEAMKLVAQNREELASVNYQKTMIVFSNNPEHFYVVQLSLKDPIKPKVLVLELGHLEDLQKIKENLDETSLYTHTYPMQRTESDCYSFALYLAKRLEVIERYIPNGRDGTPGELFKYLELHIEEVQEGINASKLPLALVLSTQSSQLWKTIIKTYPPEEQRHVMTKRGEIFDDLIGLEGQQGRHKKIIEDKAQNRLIESFFIKNITFSKKFLATTPISRVLELEHRTTLDYLKSQVATVSETVSAGAGGPTGPSTGLSTGASTESSATASPASSGPSTPRSALLFSDFHSEPTAPSADSEAKPLAGAEESSTRTITRSPSPIA